MAFSLLPLPYPAHALEPHVSRRTMEYHHGKHHDTYVNNLNQLIEGKAYATMPLEEIIRKSAEKPGDRAIFNNAAQSWNHTEFWNSMRPDGGGEPRGEIAGLLRDTCGGYASFRQEFLDAAVGRFGSGWVWLVLDGARLAVLSTPNADTPLTSGKTPLLVCDVWEHAYYLDYQNRRKAFVEAFLDHLVNWERVALRLRKAETTHAG
jgi:Fe-Mn family superoxide dismutase